MTTETQNLNKSAAISARALPEERAALQEIAKVERRRPSEVVRLLIRNRAAELGVWPGHPTKQEAGK